MKTFLTDFKEFIAKGNVMAMAVCIIIGRTFSDIINSVVSDVISPVIGLILGGIDFSAISFGVGDAQIMIGNLINAIIIFLITAITLFLIIKSFNKFDDMKKKEEASASEDESVVPEDILLLSEIRDLLKK